MRVCSVRSLKLPTVTRAARSPEGSREESFDDGFLELVSGDITDRSPLLRFEDVNSFTEFDDMVVFVFSVAEEVCMLNDVDIDLVVNDIKAVFYLVSCSKSTNCTYECSKVTAVSMTHVAVT